MTLAEKLDSSCVVSRKREKASKYGIKQSKSRWLGLIVFILMSAFTIYSKFVNKGDKNNLTEEFLNYSLICIGLKLFFTLILKFIDKSVFALNHNFTYRLVKLLGNVSTTLVFFFTMVAYINKSLEYWNEFAKTYCEENNLKSELFKMPVPWLINVITFTPMIKGEEVAPINFIWNIFVYEESFAHMITYILCLVTIITFIPTLFYFVVILLKTALGLFLIYHIAIPALLIMLCPVIHLLVLIKLLARPSPRFRYIRFDEEDKNYVFVESRKMVGGYNRLSWFWKNFLIMLPFTLIIVASSIVYCTMIYTSYTYGLGFDLPAIMSQMSKDFSWLPFMPFLVGMFS